MIENSEGIRLSQTTWLTIALVLLTGLIFAAYSNTFDVPFYLDDLDMIVENPIIKLNEFSFEGLWAVISHEFLKNRPVAFTSIALNYMFFRLEPSGWHIFNLTVHILSATVFFLLLHLTMTGQRFRIDQNRSIIVSLATALVWALHPVQTQAVTYVIQRMTSLSAMFYLSALLSYIVGTRAKRMEISVAAYAFCLILWCLALGTKENSATLPFALILYELCTGTGTRSAARIRVLFIFLLALLTIGAMFIGPDFLYYMQSGYESRHFSLYERLLTESRVFFYYISLLLFPHPSRLNLDYDFTLSRSLIDPVTTLFAVTFFTVLLLFGVLSLKKRTLFGFAALWFIGHLLIESTILPLEIAFEHRLYLPSAGLIAVAVPSLLLGYSNRWVWGLAFLACLLLVTGTYTRNELWRDPVKFHRDIASKSPEKTRVWVNLSNAMREAGDYKGAIEAAYRGINARHFEEPHFRANAYLSLGRVLSPLKEFERAREALNKALELDDKNPKIWLTLGLLDIDEGLPKQAIEHLKIAAGGMSENYRVWGGLAAAAHKTGRYDDAIRWAGRSLELNPDDAVAMVTIGNTYFSLSNMGEAEKYFSRAILKGRVTEDVLKKRVLCWIRTGKHIRAIAELEQMVDAYPDNDDFKDMLCMTYKAVGRLCDLLEDLSGQTL